MFRHVPWLGFLHHKILIILYLLNVILRLHLFRESKVIVANFNAQILIQFFFRIYQKLAVVYYKIFVDLFNSSKLVNNIEYSHQLSILAFQKDLSFRNEIISSSKMPKSDDTARMAVGIFIFLLSLESSFALRKYL